MEGVKDRDEEAAELSPAMISWEIVTGDSNQQPLSLSPIAARFKSSG